MTTTRAVTDSEAFLGEAEAFERFGEYHEALDLARCALRWSEIDAASQPKVGPRERSVPAGGWSARTREQEMGAPPRTRSRAEAAVVRYEQLVRATEAENKARRMGHSAVAAPTVRRSLWREIVDWMRGTARLPSGEKTDPQKAL